MLTTGEIDLGYENFQYYLLNFSINPKYFEIIKPKQQIYRDKIT